MALIHPESSECAKGELNLFATPPTQTSIVRSQYRDYHPLTSLDRGGPLQFRVISGDKDFINLHHSVLYLKMKITTKDGTNIAGPATGAEPADTTLVFPVPYIHAAQFKNVEVYINNQLVGSSDNTYAYKAYLEGLLSHGAEGKKATLAAGMFYADEKTPESRDVHGTDAGASEGAKMRFHLTKYSKEFETVGAIHHELFDQNKFLPNNTEVRIVMHRADYAFCLMSKSDTHTDYALTLINAELKVPHCEIAPHVLEALTKQVQTRPYLYDVTRGKVKWFTRSTGRSDLSEENLITGVIPRRVVVGFVHADAFSGKFKEAPFDFQHSNVSNVVLRVDGLTIPFQSITVDFTSTKHCFMQGYLSLLQGMGILHRDKGIDIDPEMYRHGSTLYVFDIAPDSASCHSLNLVREGNISLDVKCSSDTTKALTIIVYYEVDDIIELDKNGVVSEN